uniref:Putative secreted protein n=1 Tax=Ixodes ricinus TaxID=34613 RepID=V5HAR2_IXORI
MFTLKFFILFVLAGLCFGDASNSESGTSSGNQDAKSAGSQDTNSDGSQDANSDGSQDANSAGSQDANSAGSQGSPAEAGSESGAAKPDREMGDGLPDFIGNNTEKVQYMRQLLSKCHHQNDLFKINKGNISFKNCTYICLSQGLEQTREERIPEGLLCDSDNHRCPKTGDCPTALPTLPSC